MSKIKDCLFGQIRAVDDNVFRTTDINETAMPTTIPPALVPHVAEQQIITWDNATGMNPLWNKLSHNVMHESYGNMLRQSYNIAEQHGITFISDLIPYKSAAEYDEIIRTDYSSDYALLCASLGFWWHIHLFLQQKAMSIFMLLMARPCGRNYCCRAKSPSFGRCAGQPMHRQSLQ